VPWTKIAAETLITLDSRIVLEILVAQDTRIAPKILITFDLRNTPKILITLDFRITPEILITLDSRVALVILITLESKGAPPIMLITLDSKFAPVIQITLDLRVAPVILITHDLRVAPYWYKNMECAAASTFLHIIKSGRLVVPELRYTTLLQYKRVLATVLTVKGHIDRTRQGIRSTNPTTQNTRHTTELTGLLVNPNTIRVHLLNDQEPLDIDLTIKLRNKYIMVIYCAKQNCIQITAEKGTCLLHFNVE
jgi:hypothetical protein